MPSPFKAVAAAALAAGIGSALLIAQPFQQASSVPGAATEEGAWRAPRDGDRATGPGSTSEFADEAKTASAWEQRGRTTIVRSEMDDERLNGHVVIVDHADRFFEDPNVMDTCVGDILWGTIEITNDGGTWTGTAVGTSDLMANRRGITYYAFTGSGGYEGLSAVIFEDEARGWAWNGVIFPGALPRTGSSPAPRSVTRTPFGSPYWADADARGEPPAR